MRRVQDRARSARSRKNGARSATIKSRALGALKLANEARDENVPAKRADFSIFNEYNDEYIYPCQYSSSHEIDTNDSELHGKYRIKSD